MRDESTCHGERVSAEHRAAGYLCRTQPLAVCAPTPLRRPKCTGCCRTVKQLKFLTRRSMPIYGQNNCILKTIRFENIREHRVKFENIWGFREHVRTLHVCLSPPYISIPPISLPYSSYTHISMFFNVSLPHPSISLPYLSQTWGDSESGVGIKGRIWIRIRIWFRIRNHV